MCCQDGLTEVNDVSFVQATNIHQLSKFLKSIRRAYLDLSSSFTSTSRTAASKRSLDLSKGLAAWEGVRWLSDRERDELDFQAKLILKRCMERIRDLENIEKGNLHSPTSDLKLNVRLTVRTQRLVSQRPPSLVKFLGLPTAPSAVEASNEQLTAHRASIALYLNSLLAEVGKTQQLQQETRVKRQMEKTSVQSGLGGLGTTGMVEYGAHLAGTRSEEFKVRKPLRGNESIFAPENKPYTNTTNFDEDDDADEGPIDSILTPEQIQQFENEASSLLKSTQNQLESLKKAEASLLEISALQSELVVHLSQQTELTDKLWEDAVTVTGRVDEGNRQLRKAQERNRESRLFILVFLIGASLTLLFVEFY